MKIKFLIFCVSALVLVNLNISRAESLQYSVQEKSKKDDSLSTTIETINWNFTEESFKTRETWNNFKDTINCQVKLKDIQKCEILRKDAQDDLTKSKTYIPFSLSLQLKSKLPICQRIFEEDSKNSTQVFSFLKIDMPLDTEARGKEISERLNCPVADKSSKKVDKDTKEESSKKLQGDQSIKEIEIKKAEEARLKQEEAAAKQAEISNVKEDDMARKEQSNKKIESINELDPIFSTLSALKIEQMNLAKMKLSDDIETILETTIPLKPVNGANKDLTMDQIVFDQFLTSRTKKYPTCNDNKPSCRVIFFGPLYLNNDKANNDAYVEVIEKEIK